jgi:arginyl-tRNA synthetase
MLVRLIAEIKQRFITHVQERYAQPLSQVIVEQPPKVELGDLAFPFSFELAKSLKRPPRQIASEVVESIGSLPGVASVQVAGAGYINVFFQRDVFFKGLFLPDDRTDPTRNAVGKVILEHTNINPNKAAHIGHLRNAVLGDTFARLLRFSGENVEVQNYIDDTGVQVADVVVGFRYLEQKSLEEVRNISEKFDYYCWDLYAKVSAFYEQSAENAKRRGEILKLIEEGHGEVAELARLISHRIVQCHVKTMMRLGIEYDLFPKESDILHLKFWNYAFELLKRHEAIHFETSGKHQGCWVMRAAPGEDAPVAENDSSRDYEEDKIIVRSNGTVTYVGKDIAYQLWKFGLLGMDFFYHSFFRYPDGHVAFMTNSSSNESDPHPRFGSGTRVYNVIDSRQSYLQNIVISGLRALGYNSQAERSTHFSYEMVALSPRCCEDLGIRLSEEDRKRPYVEVSGRRGLGVKADDLIDRLIEKSLQEVHDRHPELPSDEAKSIATNIATSALRYFLLKYTRNSVIAFDFREALSFEGETGPYVQYAVVRANNIFRKIEVDDPTCSESHVAHSIRRGEADSLLKDYIENELWKIIYLAAQLEFNVALSVQTAEPATIAKYLFALAQSFNNFYHRYRIISEKDPMRKRFLLGVVGLIRDRLRSGLALLGIDVPEKM